MALRGVDNNLLQATKTLTRKGPGHKANGMSYVEGSQVHTIIPTSELKPPQGTTFSDCALARMGNRGLAVNDELVQPSPSKRLLDAGADSGRPGNRVSPLHDDIGQRYRSRVHADDDLQQRRLYFRWPVHRSRRRGVECELGRSSVSKSGVG
jgi:hypothetical protein